MPRRQRTRGTDYLRPSVAATGGQQHSATSAQGRFCGDKASLFGCVATWSIAPRCRWLMDLSRHDGPVAFVAAAHAHTPRVMKDGGDGWVTTPEPWTLEA